MKLTFFLSILTITQLWATESYAQLTKLTLRLDNVKISEALREIEDQSEFFFLYSPKLIDVERKITIDAEKETISDILTDVFADQVRFAVYDRQIILTPKDQTEVLTAFQQQKVTGKVTDKSGAPLPGVSVVVKGTATGAATDTEGNFSLILPPEAKILAFSFVGMNTQEVTIGNQNIFNIVLEESAVGLEEVVVIGYGTQKKINLTGAVDAVTSQNINNRPTENVVKALQGLSPNLNITSNTSGGEMGSTMSIDIRGIGSINGGSPYILVDGIEQSLYNLNPDDIESISVLKDAAASAIYGARAAFGVILVTTKKGMKDGVNVTYSNRFTYAKPINLPTSLNAIRFAEYFNEAAQNDGQGPYSVISKETMDKMVLWQAGEISYNDWIGPSPTNPLRWDSKAGGWGNSDWFDTYFRDWVASPTHTLSVSGGNERNQFFISGSTFDQQGLLRIGDDSYTRNTLNMKVNTTVYDWMRFNILSKMTRILLERPSYSRSEFYEHIGHNWPNTMPYYPDGQLNTHCMQFRMEKGGRYNENSNEFIIIPGIELEPVKDWVIYGNLRWKLNTNGYENHESKRIAYDINGNPYEERSTSSIENYQYENYYLSPNAYTTYSLKLGNHNVAAMAGFEQEESKYKSTGAKKNDLITDLVPSISTATGKEYATGTTGHWATRSFFGRLNYNYLEKYLAEFSFRYDGSSRFGKDKRWGFFPSASAAYAISKEPFWEPVSKYVSLLKIRGSYGALGNQNVANYLYIDRLPITANLAYMFGTERPPYAGMPNLKSPDITWEKIRTINVGMDAGFLANKLTLSADYFIRETFDMLGPSESLPSVLGTGVPQTNNATLITRGFEVVVGYKNRIQDLHFDIKFLLSDAVSEVTQYYNPTKLLSSSYYEGKKLGEIWGYTSLGLFQSDEEAAGWDQSYLSRDIWRSGDVKYADLNGDGNINIGTNTVNNSGDLSIIGNSTPRFSLSTIINLNWKGFDINMLWQGVGKRDVFLTGDYFWGGSGGLYQSSAFEEHMNYWTTENPNGYYPRPYLEKGTKNQQVQTRYLQNGAYLRLKSAQLGFTVPGSLSKKLFIENLRVSISGENLLTITKFSRIFDPENFKGPTGDGNVYPLQAFLSYGVSITF